MRLAPQSTTLLYLRGLIELVHGHASAALDYANQAIAADPQSPLGHELLARERIVRFRRLRKRRRVPPERVEEAIEAAERTGADPSLIAILRAQMWSARGRRDKATSTSARPSPGRRCTASCVG